MWRSARTFVLIAIMVMAGSLCGGMVQALVIPAGGPQLSAQAAVLIDARNADLLYEKNAFLQRDPASTTKIMTALLVIEHGHLNKIVTVSRRSDNTLGSSLHIHANHRYTRLDLLRGMLLRSGNDASVALAESEAGTMERFVAEMNRKAQELGAFNTSYENTHGLTRSGHYSSAYDLALITRSALRLPVFREIVRSQQMDITEVSQHRTHTIRNTNQLLYGFLGADGVKTGTTDAAGHCLVASATRDHRQLIAVVLNSGRRWSDAGRLLEWGFTATKTLKAVSPLQTIVHRKVMRTRKPDLAIGIESHQALWVDVGVHDSITKYVRVPKTLDAPIYRNSPIGWVTVESPIQPPVRAALYPDRTVRPRFHPKRWWPHLGASLDTGECLQPGAD